LLHPRPPIRSPRLVAGDPARSAVLVDVRFQSLTGRPYSVYVLHDVGLGLNANDDTGWSTGGGLVASDGV
jgi:glucoamylase